MRTLVFVLLLSLAVLASPWRFTERFTLQGILADPEPFYTEFVRQEARFFRVARHPQSGLTYDGWNLDSRTGEPMSPRLTSAASKECLDVALLTKIVAGEPRALLLMSEDEAVEILRKKLQSYRSFARRYPLTHGYLPWFDGGHEAVPGSGWKDRLPALDNFEWVWALLVAEKVLREQGYTELALGYREFLDQLQAAAVPMFYDPVARLAQGSVQLVEGYPGGGHMTGEHGVHEGVMELMYLSLFGEGVDVRHIWDNTRMVRVEHPYATTWQGYWGSAHESWQWMFMPYRDLPEYRELFRLREIIRTQNAEQRGYRGLHASVHDPITRRYVSDGGIEGVGSQPVKSNQTLALYGSFPVIMANRAVGAAWLYNMLDAPRMQGPIGAGEAVSNDGRHFVPIKTIDGTFPILLAIMDGLEKETAAMLRERGVYDRFVEILRAEYRETFGGAPLRVEADWGLPPSPVPRAMEDWEFTN